VLTIEKVLYFKTLDLFSGVSEDALADVAQAAEEVEVEAGADIFVAGEGCSSLYAIVSGAVRIHDGEHQIARFGEREAFGIRCALDPHDRATNATAVERCLLLRLEHGVLMELIAEDIELATHIIRNLSRRLGGVEDAVFRETPLI